MKITAKELRQIIKEELSRLDEQGCADRKSGCVKKSNGSDSDTYGDAGTWYILNNKKGGVFRKGFDTKQSAKDSLEAMHAHVKHNMKITLSELKKIIREAVSSDPGHDVHIDNNDAMISGTGIGTPAKSGELSSQDQDALEAQLRGLNSQRQIALNKKDAATANELAINIAKIEKMLNA